MQCNQFYFQRYRFIVKLKFCIDDGNFFFHYTEENNVHKYKMGIPLLSTLRYAAFIF